MTKKKDFEWFWDNYDKDIYREHKYRQGTSQGVNSGVCDKCAYWGTAVSSECECGEIHYWCDVCWGYWPSHEALERYEREFK